MPSPLRLGNRLLGDGAPAFIIAEAGVNHNGDIELAFRLIDIAVDAGADAVKFQTFSADRLVTAEAAKADYQIAATGANESQHAMLARLELSLEDHRALFAHCARRGILFLSTPFDEIAADELDALGVAAFKTPSGELTNLPYLQHLGAKRKPLIVSTGMANLAEVDDAIRTLEAAGARDLALLHATSAYPAPAHSVNLRAIDTLRSAFGVPCGYSDHTVGDEIAVAAVARGAAIVEKHFTVDRALPGPDHAASLEPGELAAMIRRIRAVEAALGDGRKRPVEAEASATAVARKSLVAARDLAPGEVLAGADVTAMRPGTGIPPSLRAHVIGRVVRKPVARGTLVAWSDLG